MSGKRTVGAMDADILGSVWEWAQEVDRASGHACRVTLTPTERKGVWLIRTQVASVVDGRAIAIVLQREEVWPSGRAQTLAGAIFALQLELQEQYSRLKGTPLGL